MKTTIREQTFDPHWILALVSTILASGTKWRIIPGLRYPLRLKSSAQRLWLHAFAVGHI
jgi:hypothetical protein